ncbi:MAG: hypothetical protein GF311_03295 [Candidatus Lokiarchaeota archaeon]|nr:hypothetical protein [Candidatus Lokiarchaeota archaeon]
MRIIKVINGFVTNSSSSSAPVILAVREGKDLNELFSEYGIPEHFANYFYQDNGTPERYKIEAADLEKDYNFYYASICVTDWGEGDLVPDDWEPYMGFVQRDDELSNKLRLYDIRKERENLVRDDLLLLYVGIDG